MKIEFIEDISKLSIPKKLNYPFYYGKEKLCSIATEELQTILENESWEHDFNHIGKMFGVLVVKDEKNQISYLATYSVELQ